MRLNLSTLARDRKFGKRVRLAARRAGGLSKRLAEASTAATHPVALLVSVTDELEPGVVRVEPEEDEYFGIMVGVSPSATEQELHSEIVAAVSVAVERCPLSEADRSALRSAIEAYLSEVPVTS